MEYEFPPNLKCYLCSLEFQGPEQKKELSITYQ